ncbi:MAG: T9SS type A sorting domain-containing protein, partial [Dysgonamonadaceae bacterium]|nr:T9SS type A sorting domain-containing protein [Dysgonamonadaceae bacterium]
ITDTARLTKDNCDASGIVSRIQGGKNYLYGVISLADSIASASGNELISFNGGGYIIIDSTTCFVRDDMKLDPLFKPDRTNQYARASESMKRPPADFKDYPLYLAAGWDMTAVWGIPKGGGFPIFRSLGDPDDFEPNTAIPVVKKANDLKVYSSGGLLILETRQPTSVWIYNLQGALVERIDIDATKAIALPKGLYIVKSAQHGNVSAVKVLNR